MGKKNNPLGLQQLLGQAYRDFKHPTTKVKKEYGNIIVMLVFITI